MENHKRGYEQPWIRLKFTLENMLFRSFLHFSGLAFTTLLTCTTFAALPSRNLILISVVSDQRPRSTILVRQDGTYLYEKAPWRAQENFVSELKGELPRDVFLSLRNCVTNHSLNTSNGFGFYEYHPYTTWQHPAEPIKATAAIVFRDLVAAEAKAAHQAPRTAGESEPSDPAHKKIIAVWLSAASTPQQCAEALDTWLSHTTSIQVAKSLLGTNGVIFNDDFEPIPILPDEKAVFHPKPNSETSTNKFVSLQYTIPNGFVGLEFVVKSPGSEPLFERAYAVPFSHEL